MTHTESIAIENGRVARYQRSCHADGEPVFAGWNGKPGGTLRITFGTIAADMTVYFTPEQARQIVAGLTSALD